MKRLLFSVLILSALTGAAHAERRSGSGCVVPERITLPTHQRAADMPANRLVGWIYDTNRSAAVLKSGRCTCKTFFPPWDAAVAEFESLFGGLSVGQATPGWARDYGKKSRTLLDEARTMCIQQGVF